MGLWPQASHLWTACSLPRTQQDAKSSEAKSKICLWINLPKFFIDDLEKIFYSALQNSGTYEPSKYSDMTTYVRKSASFLKCMYFALQSSLGDIG